MAVLADNSSQLRQWIRNEVEFGGKQKIGARGKPVRRIQEWLGLHGISVVIDGDFGPATQSAIREFQKRNQIAETGEVNEESHAALVAPMWAVLKNPLDAPTSLEDAVVRFAQTHLSSHPQEVGGQNRGPWVRLYMKGNEGQQWPWCAGFVSFVLSQACEALEVRQPIGGSFSCDVLAHQAKSNGLFVAEDGVSAAALKPGWIFLRRRTPQDWTHTGFCIRPERQAFASIEGNTNDEGNREGYEVCTRFNSYPKRDFIRLSS